MVVGVLYLVKPKVPQLFQQFCDVVYAAAANRGDVLSTCLQLIGLGGFSGGGDGDFWHDRIRYDLG